jgi:hypothetical protein
MLVLAGVGHLRRGELEYPNYWGGRVFAPFAIVGGLVGLLAIGARDWRQRE